MKKNKISLLLVTLATGVLLCQNASAVTWLFSPINISGTGNLGTGITTGSAEGWGNTTGNVTVTNGTGSLDGTGLGLVASSGDKVWISASPSLNARNQFATNLQFNVGIAPFSYTNYYSFLYRFNVGTDITNPAGQIIIRLNRANSGTTAAQDWDLLARTNGGFIQIGIQKGVPPNVTNFAAVNISAGQTFFVVVRQFATNGVSNDIDDLWINPPTNSFGADESSFPPSDAEVGALTTDGAEDTSTTGPGRFVVASGANANFDELRIASTWAEATPYFGQCISAGIGISPISQTNVAEIADTFTVIPIGTSPTYQWQFAPPGSSTFTNIPGATLTSYTTPNLVLATDNGDQYRAIVTVPCDSSMATSAVAKVTLTAPVATPPGVVVDDLFPSIAEPIVPVTVSNASWYTALGSASLDILNGGAGGPPMTLTPASGSASLWLAYFTPTNIPPTNNLPVHLAIGSTLKLTMPFTPSSFNSFTNNSTLRFGLYDYADGGTRVVADDATAGGSTGNGNNVRGYMLSLDFGPTFSVNSNLVVLARNVLNDNNLMGSTSDYAPVGSGPVGGMFSNAPAFIAGDQYTLVFSVTRNDVNSVIITNSITGGGTNWTFSVTETNFAYHRFDAFGIRPNSLETSADSFIVPNFKVEVLAGPSLPTNISLTSVSRNGGNVTLAWNPNPAGTYSYSVQRKLNLTDASWLTLTNGTSATTYTDTTATGSTGFYRVSSP
ncbi:MAG TPA: hypothetical protein VGH42_05695 [Verrucomicrobiae bacterium]